MKLLLSLTTIIILLVGAEFSTRFFMRKFKPYRAHERFVIADKNYPLLNRYKSNIRWRGVARGELGMMIGTESCARQDRFQKFITDSHGFRTQMSDNNLFVAMGDSFTSGVGLSQDEIWPSMVEAYNMAIPGSPWQQTVMWRLEGERLGGTNAVIVWQLFSGNDLDDRYADTVEPTELKGLFRPVLLNRSVMIRIIRNRITNATTSVSDNVIRCNNYYPSSELLYKPYLRNTSRTVQDVKAMEEYKQLKMCISDVRSRCKKLYIVIVPSKEEVWVKDPQLGFQKAITEWCSDNGIPCLDLYDKFKPYGLDLFWIDDTHCNKEGQILIAKSVINLLKGE